MADFEVEFELQPLPEMEADFEIAVLNNEHDLLIHRDYADQHPISAITGLTEALAEGTASVEAEAQARQEADNALQTAIDNEVTRATGAESQLSSDITAENQRAEAAESALNAKIESETARAEGAESSLQSAISAEATTRATEITRVEGLISAEENRATSAEEALSTAISSEITAREQADTTLQDNITSLQSGKADKATTLSGYGITNAYTKTEVDTALSGKQNTISDLSTIRSNASAGKSASDTIATYGNIVTHNANEFATAAQGSLADTAVQPDDLAEVATSGDYDDLINKPTIPAAQVNSDWNATSGKAQILNKPNLALVATSGSYNDLSNKPTIGNGTLTIQANGTEVATFTANQTTNTIANISIPNSATWGNITGTLSNQTDLNNALNAKANDADVVHKVGDETIAGVKTFSSNLRLLGDTTAGSKEGGEIFFGSGEGETNAGKPMSIDRYNGTFRFFGRSSSDATNIPLTVDIEHNTVLISQLGQSPRIVNLNDCGYFQTFANADSTTIPTVQTVGYCRAIDKNNEILGDIRFVRSTSGNQTTTILARNKITGTQKECAIACAVDKDGNVYTSAPTPAVSDNSTKIATTAFVNNKFQVVSTAPASPTTGVYYLVTTGQIYYGSQLIVDTAGKQDTITDLATIRSGAALGATAVQPSDLSEVATSGSYNDLTDKPTIGNGSLTIQANGTDVATFRANQTGNTTANISIPDRATWGNITGTLSNQTDLNNALAGKYDSSNPAGYTSNVGTVTSVNNVSPVNGNVTLPIPTVDQTYSASSTNAQSGVAVASAISGKANDSDVVKLTGNQTIQGVKSFSSNLRLLGDTTAGSKEGGEIFFGSGEGELNAGKSMSIDRYNGTFRFFGRSSSDAVNSPLTVDIQNNAVLGVTPPAGDTGKRLATTGWIADSSMSTALVHRAGNETISGVKIFGNGNSNYNLEVRGKSTDTSSYASIALHVPNIVMCYMITRSELNGIQFRTGISTNANYSSISFKTEDVTNNSNCGATTAWFNQKVQVVSTAPASPTTGVYYLVTTGRIYYGSTLVMDANLTNYTGYDATKTQTLKNVNGTLTWVDD